jgi:predicted pyridoxine 5'-phosphate oxidase superfamily flavin-nucleotide-binding protein
MLQVCLERNSMANQGWPFKRSPFHVGEQQIQTRLGVRDDVEARGRRIIRDYLLDQHQAFYQHLSYAFLSAAVPGQFPVTTMVWGQQGFIFAEDSVTLVIDGGEWSQTEFLQQLEVGQSVGMLGLDFSVRRRNRLTARVVSAGNNRLVLSVIQSYGNCPKYIQKRDCELSQPVEGQQVAEPANRDQIAAIVARTDTFFIGSSYQAQETVVGAGSALGGDMSHRGGQPGFIRLAGDELVFADYAGNGHFSTLGNILLNPKVSLLLLDFTGRQLLSLAGHAKVNWHAEPSFAGSERQVSVAVDFSKARLYPMPLRWGPLTGY